MPRLGWTVPGVLGVERVRIRRAGSRYFADIAVCMARNLAFQAADALVSEVRHRIQHLLGDSDVVVHAVPRAPITESTFDRIRAAALRNNLPVHDISVQDLAGEIHVELHVELDETMTLIAAHDRVTALEADIRAHVPEIGSILTHIESEPATVETGGAILRDRALEEKFKAIGACFPDVVDVHEIVFKRVRGHIFLSCHVTMHDNLPLARVHDTSPCTTISRWRACTRCRPNWRRASSRRHRCFACSSTPSRRRTIGDRNCFTSNGWPSLPANFFSIPTPDLRPAVQYRHPIPLCQCRIRLWRFREAS